MEKLLPRLFPMSYMWDFKLVIPLKHAKILKSSWYLLLYHDMDTSVLLALWGGGGWMGGPLSHAFPYKGAVVLSFDVLFDVSWNKLFNKMPRHQWFENQWCSCDFNVMWIRGITEYIEIWTCMAYWSKQHFSWYIMSFSVLEFWWTVFLLAKPSNNLFGILLQNVISMSNVVP